MFNARGSVTCVVRLPVFPEHADDLGNGMDQDVWNRDDGYLAQAARMIAAALVSAALTATIVIAVGHSMIEREAALIAPGPGAVPIRTAG